MTQTSLSDYDYTLPKGLIADTPLHDRSACRLLLVNRAETSLEHLTFREIENYFKPGDTLVLNDTKVFAARLFGRKKTGAKVEVFLLKRLNEKEWEVMLRPGGKLRKGDDLILGEGFKLIEAKVADDSQSGQTLRKIEFRTPVTWEDLQGIGHIPLPPYIERPDREDDKTYYQTVYAREYGAVAAPTAGLHFDEALLLSLKEKGVEIVNVTLHVGYGTFRPVTCEDFSKHEMEEEFFEISETSAAAINKALQEKRRVIACGTTVVRCLESAVNAEGTVQAGKSSTRLFIYPPYTFKAVQGLITNFHLPKSTLLMLVSAFGGYDLVEMAYQEAVEKRYRFYSYGDAMFVL